MIEFSHYSPDNACLPGWDAPIYKQYFQYDKYDIIEVGEIFVYGRLHLDTAFDIYNSITEEVDEAELEQGEIGGDENKEPNSLKISNLMASLDPYKQESS